MPEIKNEVWKAWPRARYVQGSSLGRVRTLNRTVKNGTGTRFVKGRILTQHSNKDGYMQTGIRIDRKKVAIKVHRLIAECFIPNPDNLPQVNHKDCDRANNHVENLEWCDASYNMQYREKYGVSQTEKQGRPVIVINLTTLSISGFYSHCEVKRSLGIDQSSIGKVIKGMFKQSGGYWFVNADSNAVESTRAKFGDSMANKVAELLKATETK